mmetsp:Transcript_12683/g.38033  ORF Transcript_12683/g.38033 Transcript_12683/m.38033 type:complete len:126 (-) Transcript_12683:212-589(-)
MNVVTTSQEFFDWVEQRAGEARALTGGELRIFLATDNPSTRLEFEARYGPRVVTYGEMRASDNVRLTTIEQAVCDAFIASRALEFKGTFGTLRSSSFSAMILQFWRGRHVGRKICTPSSLDTACK